MNLSDSEALIRGIRHDIYRSDIDIGLTPLAEEYLKAAMALLAQAEAQLAIAGLHQAHALAEARAR